MFVSGTPIPDCGRVLPAHAAASIPNAFIPNAPGGWHSVCFPSSTTGTVMSDILHDIRLAMRTLAGKPSFSLLAVLTLAAGITLNVIAVSLIDAYLWRSLPYPAAERLYEIRFTTPPQPPLRGLDKLDWSALSGVIEHSIYWDLDMFYMTGESRAESVAGAWVPSGFMNGFGIKPRIGRTFSPEEYAPGAPQVALISHSLWHNRFGGDPAILGRRFSAYVSDRPDEAELFTIIGVLPENFWHLNRYTGVLAPLRAPGYPYMVRLRPDVSESQARTAIETFIRRSVTNIPPDWTPSLVSTHARYTAPIRPALFTAAAAAAIVLLIACANVAFLLVVRATARQKEVGIRMALGASSWRILRLFAAETLVLGALSALLALVIVSWSLDGLAPLIQEQLGRPAPGGTSAVFLSKSGAAAAMLSMLLTLALGLLPFIFAFRRERVWDLRFGGRSMTAGTAASRARFSLIALEVAGAVTLLAGAGLMVRTTWNLLSTTLGFQPQNVLTTQIGIRQRSYPDDASRSAFVARLLSSIQAIPGVNSAALSTGFAFQPPPDQRLRFDRQDLNAGLHRVSPGYFQTLGTRLLAGREFSSRDAAQSPPVAILSQSLAARIAGDPLLAIGRTIILPAVPTPAADNLPPSGPRTVVGVVADTRQSLRDDELLDLYLPVLQAPSRFFSLYLDSSGPLSGLIPPLESALRVIDSQLSISPPRPFRELVGLELARPRFLSSLLGALAIFSAGLAILGVYGLIAFAVRQREREIAIRMALGAAPSGIVRHFLTQGARVIVIGIAAGLAGAIAFGRALQAQLHGVAPGDPLTIGLTAALVALAALSAMVLPARRAASRHPGILLHED